MKDSPNNGLLLIEKLHQIKRGKTRGSIAVMKLTCGAEPATSATVCLAKKKKTKET